MNTDKIISLFDSYADDLYRFALSYMGSKQEAEDIVQDVFLKLLSKKIFINSDYEKPYLFKMTWRILLSHSIIAPLSLSIPARG